MRNLVVFNSITLDGYFTGPNGDLSWAHNQDPEWNAVVAENAGRTMFEGVQEKLSMKLTSTRKFKNGNVLMCYDGQA